MCIRDRATFALSAASVALRFARVVWEDRVASAMQASRTTTTTTTTSDGTASDDAAQPLLLPAWTGAPPTRGATRVSAQRALLAALASALDLIVMLVAMSFNAYLLVAICLGVAFATFMWSHHAASAGASREAVVEAQDACACG